MQYGRLGLRPQRACHLDANKRAPEGYEFYAINTCTIKCVPSRSLLLSKFILHLAVVSEEVSHSLETQTHKNC